LAFFNSGKRTGTGSGVILDKEGYILTNNHVVEGANKITVRLFDDTQFKGTVVGTDPEADLAVVKNRNRMKRPDRCKNG